MQQRTDEQIAADLEDRIAQAFGYTDETPADTPAQLVRAAFAQDWTPQVWRTRNAVMWYGRAIRARLSVREGAVYAYIEWRGGEWRDEAERLDAVMDGGLTAALHRKVTYEKPLSIIEIYVVDWLSGPRVKIGNCQDESEPTTFLPIDLNDIP